MRRKPYLYARLRASGPQNFCALHNDSSDPFFAGRVSHSTSGDYPLVSNTRQTLSYKLTGGSEVSIPGTSFAMCSARRGR